MKTRINLLTITGLILTMLYSAATAVGNMTNEELVQRILNVSGLEGEAYLQGRKGLEIIYKNNEVLFDKVINSSSDWQVIVLGKTVKERANKSDKIEKFVGTKMQYSDTRSWEQKIDDVGADMATQGKNVPMIMVEKIWKNNELNNWPLATADGYASICYAIGRMGLINARPILENVLTNDLYCTDRMEIIKSKARPVVAIGIVRGYAAGALGRFKDPRSVPALLSVLESETGSHEIYPGAPAGQALRKCLDKDSLKYLEEKKVSTKKEKLKEVLQNIINEYNKCAAEEAKTVK